MSNAIPNSCLGASALVWRRCRPRSASRGVLQTEFTTRNTVQPDAQIRLQLLHGPFRDLTGDWRFEPIGTRGSRVHFRVEFEFKNRLTATAFNAVFEAMCGTIIDAFVLRAQTVYAG
jgi:ribosome-associated toxin RatA of RatAB toxin-antitoxin module